VRGDTEQAAQLDRWPIRHIGPGANDTERRGIDTDAVKPRAKSRSTRLFVVTRLSGGKNFLNVRL
jgi:hypothetical protein